VLFGRHHTNLHSIWDTDIPVKHEGGKSKDESDQASGWADRLVEIGAGPSWLRCTDISTAEKCAVAWAGEANKYVCSYVLKDDVDGVTGGRDLSTDYYEGAVPIVDELVGKAGFRLAAWIEALAAQRAAAVASGIVFSEQPSRKDQVFVDSEDL
jgi:S1/P1 Nuclease